MVYICNTNRATDPAGVIHGVPLFNNQWVGTVKLIPTTNCKIWMSNLQYGIVWVIVLGLWIVIKDVKDSYR